MKNSIAFAVGLIFGSGVGAFITWRVLNAKYDARFNAEVESIRKVYHEKESKEPEKKPEPELKPEPEVEEEKPQEKAFEDYAETLKKAKYLNDTAMEMSGDYPYSIPEEDVGENYDYNEVDLYYFADGVLTDEDYEPMDNDDIRESIGANWKDSIGNYDDTELACFCNDARQCYYKVHVDERTYGDVYKIPGYRE